MFHFSPLPMHAIISSRRPVHRHSFYSDLLFPSRPERLFNQGVFEIGTKNYKNQYPRPLGISRCGSFCTFNHRRAASSLKKGWHVSDHAHKTCCICTAPDVTLNSASPSTAAPALQRKMYRIFHPWTNRQLPFIIRLSEHESRGSDELSPPHYSQFPSFSA